MDKKKVKSGILDSKILWAILSLLVSLLLWVYVTTSLGEVTARTFDGVQVVFKGEDALHDREDLVLSGVSASSVSIRLRTTYREFAKLSSSTITAEVDVSQITTKGFYTLAVTPRFPPGTNTDAITVISTYPSSISFDVDKTVTKTIPVDGKFIGKIAEGFAQQPMRFEPQSITVSGPGDIVAKIDHAWIEVGRDNVDKTIKADYPYQLMDKDGVEIEKTGLELSHDTISVTVPINATKEVPLTADLIEGGGATAENVEISFEPATITIAGDAETLDGINKISVGTIDLASFAVSYEDKHAIVLDNAVTNVTGIKEAKVTIKVIGLETKKFDVTNITTVNASAGRTVSVITESLVVTLRGESSVLNKIESNNIRAVADLADFGATGVFNPVAKIYVDGFTGVGAVSASGPYSIHVKIK